MTHRSRAAVTSDEQVRSGLLSENEPVTGTPELAGYHRVGPRKYLDRLLAEYQLSDGDVAGAVTVRTPPGAGGKPGPPEYLLRETLLRSHDPFPCAGDSEAREFCLSIASEIVLTAQITLQEAIERINQHWSKPAPGQAAPRMWIAGQDLTYHEDAAYWARVILEQTG
jgi:hypothetical protein